MTNGKEIDLSFSSLSDIGNIRAKNEDFLFTGQLTIDSYLFAVADGIGGHNSGEVASYKAVTGIVKALKKDIGKETMETLEDTIIQINDKLVAESSKENKNKGMGTTLSALYIKKNTGYIVHVGDSRIYRYSESKGLEQLTEDHSLVEKLKREGIISQEDAQNHPKRNVLYQSIGTKANIQVQKVGPFPIKKGQKYLLCTDGLYNEISDQELEELIQKYATKNIVDNLIKKVKSRQGLDNITIIALSTVKERAIFNDTKKMPNLINRKEKVKKNRFVAFKIRRRRNK
jgi:protein phosphatase